MTGADGDAPPGVFDAVVREGVCRLRRPGTRWLSTGHDGGVVVAPAAYNVSVPEGWPETDLDAYARERRAAAGFAADADGPTLFTGVDAANARRARFGAVEAVATAGVSNPAALPVPGVAGEDGVATAGDPPAGGSPDRPGTVNVVVGTTRALASGALANLVAVAAEAKAATLLARVGVPGTTTDAVVAACAPDGRPATYSGSATPVGRAARVCVRDALSAALDARYGDAPPPTVADAAYGLETTGVAHVSTVAVASGDGTGTGAGTGAEDADGDDRTASGTGRGVGR